MWNHVQLNNWPIFFPRDNNTADVYLDLLTEYVAPQLLDSQPTFILQQNGAPSHWGLRVRQFLNKNIFRPMDWKRWTNFLATLFTRHHSPRLLSMGLCEGYGVSNKGAGHN